MNIKKHYSWQESKNEIFTNYLLITNKYNQIDIFEVGEVIPENYSIINEFFIGPYNYDLSSFNADEDCSLVTVLNQAKKEAIDLGGDALKIITLKEPTVGNPCYTIKALALIKNNK